MDIINLLKKEREVKMENIQDFDNAIEIIQFCIKKDCFPGKSGNFSFRTGGGFFITRAGKNLNFSISCSGDPVDGLLTEVSMRGKIPKEASSESHLHRKIYSVRKDVQVIIHTHSAELIAQEDLFFLANYPYTRPDIEDVIKKIKKHDLIVLPSHGAIVVGETFMDAYEKLDEAINHAKIWIFAR